jgi:glycosyltransferase involved in cell wall biosynthesis
MKVLLSAYACAPNQGSEPGVGWNWGAKLAARGHEVVVITRSNNRRAIESEMAGRARGSLRFVYYDLPKWARWWKKGRRGIHLYYLLWQWGAYRVARRLLRKTTFDLVHHVTLASLRQPSFMGLLGIPFIFGPVAGGESVPRQLRQSFPRRGRIQDALRDFTNRLIRFDPLMRMTFSRAEQILVTSPAAARLLPACSANKAKVRLAIGVDLQKPVQAAKNGNGSRLLYAGNLLYLKGVHLALRTLAEVRKKLPHASLTVIGSGPDEHWLRRLARDLGVEQAVTWVGKLPQQQLFRAYREYDALLFPSLRDSGGLVVLEALAQGLPVICLDLGGPGVIVDDSCGRRVATGQQDEAGVVRALAKHIEELASDPQLLAQLHQGAYRRACEFSWDALVSAVYDKAGSQEHRAKACCNFD